MTTYYQDEETRITSEAVWAGGRAYPLEELTRVWYQRGARSWRAVAGRGALTVGVLIPVALLGTGIVLALTLNLSLLNRILIAVGGGAAGFVVLPVIDVCFELFDRSYARGTRTHELWAEWRGTQVLLLRTRDALTFGRVYRALQRALERRVG